MLAMKRHSCITAMPRLVQIFATLVLTSGAMAAHAGSVTMGGVSEELATNRALAKVPQGKSVTDTTCEVIGTAGHSRSYRCTVTWD